MSKSNLVGGKWKILNEIGKGQFASVYKAENITDQNVVAVKIARPTDSDRLKHEYEIYQDLHCRATNKFIGFPKMMYYGTFGEKNALVMDLLGPSLHEMLNRFNGKLSLKSVFQIGIQMTKWLEHMHTCGWIHCDMKPANMMISTNHRDSCTVYLADLGHSERFIDSDTNRHRPLSQGRSYIGTPKYMSTNMHNRFQLSRRDDLESLAYVMVFLFLGKLPWSGILGGTRGTLMERIARVKLGIPIHEICSGMPKEMVDFLQYSRDLGFEEKPDYGVLRNMLHRGLSNIGESEDRTFEWTRESQSRGKAGLSGSQSSHRSTRA